MKKLKIILKSKYFFYILIIVTIIYSFIIINFNPFTYKTSNNIKGKIIEIKKYDKYNYLKIKINNFRKIIAYDYENKNYKIGDIVRIKGEITNPNVNTNFYLFNYENYLKSYGIFNIIKSKSIKILKHSRGVYKLKNKIINYINSINNNYINAFILGDNDNIDVRVKDSYKINGISHLFAISGMHVSLFILLINFVLKKIFNLKYEFVIVILFLLFYCFLTNYTKSILRTTMFYIISTLNTKLKLNISIKHLIIMLLCINIIFNPFNIYNIGFVFSYLISITLIFNKEIINTCTSYLKKILTISLLSFLVSIPILINNYFEINLLSPIINLLYVPFISFIIFPLSLIVTLFPFLNFVLEFFLAILEKSSLLISKFSFFKITLCHINYVFVIIYYCFIYLSINGIKIKKFIYCIPLVLIIIIHYNYSYFNVDFKCIFLDINQGDSTLLIYPKNKLNILIDTGGAYNKDLTHTTLIPILKSRGIDKISYLIITHGDFDHMGEAINLVNNYKVEKVIFNCGPYNDLEKELIKVLDRKKIKYYSCIKELNIDKNKLYFLQTKEYDNENDNSNVIYTEFNGYKFMFMGDASITTEKEILNEYNLPDIDVLKVGHHGSKTSSSEEFINEINPKYSIISVGNNNRYGHPNKEVLGKLDKSKIYRTDQNGSIMFKIKNNKLKVETCSP